MALNIEAKKQWETTQVRSRDSIVSNVEIKKSSAFSRVKKNKHRRGLNLADVNPQTVHPALLEEIKHLKQFSAKNIRTIKIGVMVIGPVVMGSNIHTDVA